MIRTLVRCTQFKRKTNRTKRRKREEIKMMKRELTVDQMEQVNGGRKLEIIGSDTVVVRDAADIAGDIIGTVQGGDILEYNGARLSGGHVTWRKVIFDGGVGWISAKRTEVLD